MTTAILEPIRTPTGLRCSKCKKHLVKSERGEDPQGVVLLGRYVILRGNKDLILSCDGCGQKYDIGFLLLAVNGET